MYISFTYMILNSIVYMHINFMYTYINFIYMYINFTNMLLNSILYTHTLIWYICTLILYMYIDFIYAYITFIYMYIIYIDRIYIHIYTYIGWFRLLAAVWTRDSSSPEYDWFFCLVFFILRVYGTLYIIFYCVKINFLFQK